MRVLLGDFCPPPARPIQPTTSQKFAFACPQGVRTLSIAPRAIYSSPFAEVGRAAPSIQMMSDLTNPRLIYLKALLLLLCGALASAGLLMESPTLKTTLLLALAVWCFARFYYFCFYVIQHYIDPGYRFVGLWSLARYLVRKRDRTKQKEQESTTPT